ncbi:MAG: MATE family efflux transporter [Candidatus Thermoplasmatota archaeon]
MSTRAPVGDQTTYSLGTVWRAVTRPDLPTTRKVLTIAWPVVLTNLLQSLALTVDLIMVASLGVIPQASMGFATQVFMVGMTVAGGLGAGAVALVARGVGAGDQTESDRSTTSAVLLSLALSVPLILVTYFFDAPLLRLMTFGSNTPETNAIIANGSLVLHVLAWGIPGYMVMTTATGAMQGAGDTRPGLYIGVSVNVVNLALDWVLIYGHLGFHAYGLAGAAAATAVSYTAGGFAFLWLLSRGARPARLRLVAIKLRETSERVLRVGGPAFLEQFLLNVGFLAYLLIIIKFGAASLSAHQIGLRVQSFAFMPGFGFAAAASALVGQGLGQGRPGQAERDGWMATGMGFLCMVALSAPMFFLAEPMARLFTSDPEALRLSIIWIHVLVIAMPAIAFHFTAAGALRGAGDTRWPLLVSFAGLWLIRLPVAWYVGVVLDKGMYGVWAGYVIEYYLRAGVTTWRYARGSWKTLTV